MKFSLEAV